MANKIVFIKAAFPCKDPNCRLNGGHCIKCLAAIMDKDYEDVFNDSLDIVDVKPQLPHKSMAKDDKQICDAVGFKRLKTKAKVFQIDYKEKGAKQ